MSDQASTALNLLRKARDLEQEAEGLRCRARRLLRREMNDVVREEARAPTSPTSTPTSAARAGVAGGREAAAVQEKE